MGLKKVFVTMLLVLLISTHTLKAQVTDNSVLERFERQMDQIRMQTRTEANLDVPVDQRLLLDYGGSLTLSYGAIDDSNRRTHQFNQYQLIGYARLNLDGVHNFFVRGSSTYRDFHPATSSFDSHGDDWREFQLDRAVYRFDLSRYMAAYKQQTTPVNVIFEGGRQYIHWFNGLVFSGELDGAQVTIEWDKLMLKGLAGTTTRRTIDMDSVRPLYDSDTHRDIYAGAVSYRINEHHTPFLYGLVQQDHNNTGVYSDGTNDTAFDYESWYLGMGSQGTLSDQLIYNVELVYEGGRGLNSIYDANGVAQTQTYDDISAYAMAANLTYQFKDDNFSRADGEVIIASGDSDRLLASSAYGGNLAGTLDTGFNAMGSMDTGLAFAPEVTNLMMLRLGASTFPLVNHKAFKRLQLGGNVYLYGKLDAQAPVEETSNHQTFLGVETDLFANWQITSDLSMAMRYGIFFPGAAMPDSNPRNFFFTSLTLAF